MNRTLSFLFYASFLAGMSNLSAAETIDATAANQTPSTAETAKRSEALVDFLGVNAHAAGDDAAWQPVLGALRTLGVRHVRDTANPKASQAYFDRHQQLGALGIKALFTAPNGVSETSLEAFAARVSADAEGLEAPSGLDGSNGAGWLQQVQADVTTVHAVAAAKGMLSIGPTMAFPGSYASLADLSAKQSFAGVSSLPCVGVEEQTVLHCLSGLVKTEEQQATSRPYFVTGAALAQTTASSLPASVAAVYLPRVLLEEWNAGAKRSYRADLDPASASEFALLNKDGSETAAFRAMAALVSLLQDPSGDFAPAQLEYSVTGVDDSVHHALFQKRDGTFYLALWIEASSYDAKTHTILTVPGQVAKLETAVPMDVTTYEFDETGNVTAKGGGLSTPQMIPVTDRLLVVKLTPQTTTPAMVAAAATSKIATTATATAFAATSAKPADNANTSPATYYVANNGDDANDGLSPAHPWKTIAKLNASTSLYKPGTAILLNRGDVWHDDYIRLQNQVNPVAATTLTNTPLPIAGTASQPIVIGAYGAGANPLIDGADPLNVTWTRVTPTTWKATVASLPSKIYVDSLTAETVALVPQANSKGAFKANTPYDFLDLVTANGAKYVVYGPGGAVGTTAVGDGQPWQSVTNTATGNHSQTFSATNSGLANVEATPGSWYGSGKTVYVHLADGSDPNRHVLEGTYRQYGVLLMSVNYVTVENLAIERVLLDGIAMGTYTDSSLAGQYFSNEYNSALNNTVWNWGNLGTGCLPMRHSCYGSPEAGILSIAFMKVSAEAIRGTTISGNYVGRSDQYFGLRAQATVAGIQAIGQNAAEVSNNTIVTVNNQCLNYQSLSFTPNNIGGDIGYNHCGKNQGNFFFGMTVGGRLHHNIAENSAGEGIQLGGNDNGGMIDHNLLYNLDIEASGIGINGVDCNGNGSYMTLANNTIVNVYGASLTLETGCDHAYVVNNVLDMRSPNTGYFYYWLFAQSPSATFRNNLYSSSIYGHPFTVHYTLETWKAYTGETTAVQKDPIYVNPAQGDYRLAPSSPGVRKSWSVSGATGGGLDQGADLATP